MSNITLNTTLYNTFFSTTQLGVEFAGKVWSHVESSREYFQTHPEAHEAVSRITLITVIGLASIFLKQIHENNKAANVIANPQEGGKQSIHRDPQPPRRVELPRAPIATEPPPVPDDLPLPPQVGEERNLARMQVAKIIGNRALFGGLREIGFSSESNGLVAIDLSHPEMGTNFRLCIENLRDILAGWREREIQVHLPQGGLLVNREEMLKHLNSLLKDEGLPHSPPTRALLGPAPARLPDEEGFKAYCSQHRVGYRFDAAWRDAREGILLLQKIRNGEEVLGRAENIRKICWGMMAHAITKGRGFENGTFVVDDPGFRLFKTFTNCTETYGRASSHFTKRAIATTEGNWQGYSHFGLDIPFLPPNMRTVLIGMIRTKDGKERVYIKFEDWGADLRLINGEKAKHFFFHSLDFCASQYKTAMGTNQSHGDRKEHMNPKDIEKINELIAPFKGEITLPPPNLKDWGFADAVPYLREILKRPISPEQSQKIKDYLHELDQRYGKVLPQQKGDEVQLTDSIMAYSVESLHQQLSPEEAPKAVESLHQQLLPEEAPKAVESPHQQLLPEAPEAEDWIHVIIDREKDGRPRLRTEKKGR